MTQHFAMVFPGQGSQSVGMLQNAAQKFALIEKTFSEASHILNYDLWDIVKNGPAEKLNQTEITQPALLVASIALWRLWNELGNVKPSVLAGHSLGEYSALVCANVINFADAVNLVSLRGRYMQEAVPHGVGAMAAIIGLAEADLTLLCEDESKNNETVSCANFNSPGQIVIAGNSAAVERVMVNAKAAGAKLVKKLDVSVPSHCLLMKPAAEKLAQQLDKITFNKPTIPVIHNADVLVHDESEAIKSALKKQLVSPVCWVETVNKIAQHYHAQKIIECGPGKVLAGLNKRITDIPTINVEEQIHD